MVYTFYCIPKINNTNGTIDRPFFISPYLLDANIKNVEICS